MKILYEKKLSTQLLISLMESVIGWHHEFGHLWRHHIMTIAHTGTKPLMSLQGSNIPKQVGTIYIEAMHTTFKGLPNWFFLSKDPLHSHCLTNSLTY